MRELFRGQRQSVGSYDQRLNDQAFFELRDRICEIYGEVGRIVDAVDS